MKLPASAAASLCALLCLPATAAAGEPRAPFDFEIAPPRDVARIASAGPVVSPPLPTARAFNLVGMRWRGDAEPRIAVRVRRTGRGWSRWQSVAAHADHNPDRGSGERVRAASDPLWVGRANGVQYRMSRRVPGLRLHFVNVAAARLRTARAPRARAAQEPMPDVVSRAEWGAGGCPPRDGPSYGSVKAVHVHHTVSLNDYSPDEARAMVLAICRYHRNSNGWDDIGYNALVDKYGVLYEGRAGGLDQAVIGAQAQGFNSETAGIASIADHTSVGATPQTLDALARFIRWKLGVHGQPLSGPVTVRSSGGSASRYGAGASVTLERVIGHRDTGRTACPGQMLYDQLDDLRARVAAGVPGLPALPAAAVASVSAALADYWADHGQVVPVSGALVGPDGAALAGEPVEVQVNGDGRWVTSRRLVTGPDGSFLTDLKPRKRMYVRTAYPGRPELGRAFSSRLLLHLKPVVALERAVRRSRAGAAVPVQGTVRPRKGSVRVVLQQHVRGRYRKVGAKSVRVRRGRFRTSIVAAFVDRYRYSVVATPDDDTDRGTSGWVPLRVGRR